MEAICHSLGCPPRLWLHTLAKPRCSSHERPTTFRTTYTSHSCTLPDPNRSMDSTGNNKKDHLHRHPTLQPYRSTLHPMSLFTQSFVHRRHSLLRVRHRLLTRVLLLARAQRLRAESLAPTLPFLSCQASQHMGHLQACPALGVLHKESRPLVIHLRQLCLVPSPMMI